MSAVISILTVAPAFLRAIASAPAASSFLSPLVDELLSLGAALIEQGDIAVTQLQELTTQIENMVAAKRDPTEVEWAALRARSDAAYAIIQQQSATSSTPSA